MDRVGSQIETRDMIQYVTQDNIGITVQPFQDSYKWKEKKQQNTEFKCLKLIDIHFMSLALWFALICFMV